MFDLKEKRESMKMSQDELAKKIGVTKASISKWETGEIANMGRDKIARLSKVLNVNPLEILGLEVPKDLKTVKIPILGEIACGEPITAQENIEGYYERSPDGLPSGSVIYLRAKGASMEPKIPDGSLVLIREQADVENGEIAAVLVNGDTEATLKRVRKVQGTVILEPINPEFSPYIISKENPGRIIGKAMEVTFQL